jgi:hypothetical protein
MTMPNDRTTSPFVDQNGRARRLRGMAALSNSPWIAELISRVGFEVVWFDLEHGSLGFSDLGQLCQAAEAGGGIPLVRTADDQRTNILRALEVGAQFLLVPMIEEAAQAREIVKWSKYPPIECRGFSSRSRGAGYGLRPMEATLREMNARTHTFALIETQRELARNDSNWGSIAVEFSVPKARCSKPTPFLYVKYKAPSVQSPECGWVEANPSNPKQYASSWFHRGWCRCLCGGQLRLGAADAGPAQGCGDRTHGTWGFWARSRATMVTATGN